MARVHFVKKARKDNPVCKAGESYYWWKNRHGPKHFSKTQPRQSQTIASPKLSAITAAGERIMMDSATSWDSGDVSAEAKSAVVESMEKTIENIRQSAEEILEVGEEYRESAQNIEDGFGNRTYQCDELDERGDNCESAADALGCAADEPGRHPRPRRS